jgi:membrane protein
LLAAADGRSRSSDVAGALELYVAALNAGADAGRARQGVSSLHLQKVLRNLPDILGTLDAGARDDYFAAAGLPQGVEKSLSGGRNAGAGDYNAALALAEKEAYAGALAALRRAEADGYSALKTRLEAGRIAGVVADGEAAQSLPARAVEDYRSAVLSYCDAAVIACLYGSGDQVRQAVQQHEASVGRLGTALFEFGREEANFAIDLLKGKGMDTGPILRSAIGHLREAIEVLEHSSEAHFVLANALWEAGRTDEARQEYAAAFQTSNEAAARGLSTALVDHIRRFIEVAGRAEIGVIGVLLLLITATSLLGTIEKTLNLIWKVTERRPFWIKFTSFCTLIWLGPALIGASIWAREKVGEYVQMTLGGIPVIGRAVWLLTLAGRFVLPLVTMWLVLVALYKFLPHTRVKFASAAWAALLAALLLQGFRPLFTLYVLKAITYQRIYGSLGVVPIFLLWVWLLWLIVLFGAEVSYTMQNLSLLRDRDTLQRLTAAFVERHVAARIMMHVAREFWQSGKPVSAAQMAHLLNTTQEDAADAADKLAHLGMLVRAGEEGDEFHPARDLSKITVSEVLSLSDRFCRQSRSAQAKDQPYEEKLDEAFRAAAEAQDRALGGMTLRDLMLAAEDGPAGAPPASERS